MTTYIFKNVRVTTGLDVLLMINEQYFGESTKTPLAINVCFDLEPQ